jgi:hypothetical protein
MQGNRRQVVNFTLPTVSTSVEVRSLQRGTCVGKWMPSTEHDVGLAPNRDGTRHHWRECMCERRIEGVRPDWVRTLRSRGSGRGSPYAARAAGCGRAASQGADAACGHADDVEQMVAAPQSTIQHAGSRAIVLNRQATACADGQGAVRRPRAASWWTGEAVFGPPRSGPTVLPSSARMASTGLGSLVEGWMERAVAGGNASL